MMTDPNDSEKWSAEQLEFIAWLSLPKIYRNPKTQQLLAKKLDVHQDTLTNWKKLPGFQAAVTSLCRSLLKDNLPDVYGALTAKAIDGDVPAIKLVMEMVGEYVPNQNVNLSGSVSWRDLVEQATPRDEHG